MAEKTLTPQAEQCLAEAAALQRGLKQFLVANQPGFFHHDKRFTLEDASQESLAAAISANRFGECMAGKPGAAIVKR